MENSQKSPRIQSDLTLDETCHWLGCSRPTAYSLMHSGRLRFYKIGRSTRITYESVEDLRNSGTSDDLKAHRLPLSGVA